jgi:enoyl-CoA hydratase/carnithine racemase
MPERLDSPLVLADRRGKVLLLSFNRPDRLNAWTPKLEDEYLDLLELAEVSGDIRAVVVTGAGRGFCAGADMTELNDAPSPPDRTEHPRPRTTPMAFTKPLIAAINGAAAGVGLAEALFCDVRFCTPEAKLTTAFARRGLIAEHGLAWILPRLIGHSRALDLLMSARVITGEDAYRIGLVDRLSPVDHVVEDAVAYAHEIAETASPTCVAIIKQQIRDATDTDFSSVVRRADTLRDEAMGRPDFAEGIRSYLERRPPHFAPWSALSPPNLAVQNIQVKNRSAPEEPPW